MGKDRHGSRFAAELAKRNEAFEHSAPAEILRWVASTFGDRAVLTMSLQHEGVVIAHMLREIAPRTRILFIDTGYHFPETLAYRDELMRRLGLRIETIRPSLSHEEFVRRYGDDLHQRDPDLCCRLNKVEPMRLALRGVEAWINGRRRDQATTRRHLPILERLEGGIVKVNPLARWTAKDTYAYLSLHEIPLHPLFEQGYASIGCAPCTRPILAGEDERAGRWAGRGKTECGLHTFLSAEDEKPAAAGDDAEPANPGRRGL